MITDLITANEIALDQAGGKAFNLHKLASLGIPVPHALVVHADNSVTELESVAFQQLLNNHPVVKSGVKFAVRSSGVGEDGASNSFAGIFDSFLDISRDELHKAILRVRDSISSSRSIMYSNHKTASISAMGVVVQHMIDADYAGVAFSTSPLENDSRVALIEAVQGCGDSLVSNEKTPATLRINKITGTFRIQQKGVDQIDDATLEMIYETIMPFVTDIEEAQDY